MIYKHLRCFIILITFEPFIAGHILSTGLTKKTSCAPMRISYHIAIAINLLAYTIIDCSMDI